jgi:RHS repeat-associated protein
MSIFTIKCSTQISPTLCQRSSATLHCSANADGSWNSEIKYSAFGEVRDSSGLTPTEYRYTGQMEHSYIKLYWYRSRWYDGELAHFIQPDSIIPGAGDALSYDRYAYVKSNPILYTDPSGHMVMVEDNLFIRDDRKTGDFVFINDVGAGKLFANPVEQAAANVILNENPKYFDAMPSNCNGIPIGAAFENAGGKIGVDLGSYYTTFINLMRKWIIL